MRYIGRTDEFDGWQVRWLGLVAVVMGSWSRSGHWMSKWYIYINSKSKLYISYNIHLTFLILKESDMLSGIIRAAQNYMWQWFKCNTVITGVRSKLIKLKKEVTFVVNLNKKITKLTIAEGLVIHYKSTCLKKKKKNLSTRKLKQVLSGCVPDLGILY